MCSRFRVCACILCSYVLQNLYECLYVLPNSHVRLYVRSSVLQNSYMRPCVRLWGGSIKKKRPLLMKLYATPPSILTLVTWVPQSRLAFSQTPHIGWPSGLGPLAITILQCAASLAAGGYVRPFGPNKSLFLSKPTLYP